MNKVIAVILLLSSFLSTSSIAQNTPSHSAVNAEEIQKRVDEFKSRLQITPEQTEKLRPIFQEEAEKLRALRDKNPEDTSRRARISKLREAKSIQEEFDGKYEKILSADQMKEWKKMRKERRAKLRDEFERRRSTN